MNWKGKWYINKMKRLAEIIITLFFLGYCPYFPSIIGSLVGVIICFGLRESLLFPSIVIVILFILGGFFSKYMRDEFSSPSYRRGYTELISFLDKWRGKTKSTDDPSPVIIDEACGIMVALWNIPFEIHLVVIGLLFFHLFDGVKPPPLRRLERLPGGWGIMADDLGAGIYANILLQIAVYLGKIVT